MDISDIIHENALNIVLCIFKAFRYLNFRSVNKKNPI
jgi:hypothetical protein